LTPDSGWWDRAKTPPQPETIPVRRRDRIYALRKNQHEATLETRIVHGVGQELILSIDGGWLRMRVFKAHEPEGMRAAVRETQTLLVREGWE
jgi:hypothetical protein